LGNPVEFSMPTATRKAGARRPSRKIENRLRSLIKQAREIEEMLHSSPPKATASAERRKAERREVAAA
jgi:hypothetical protein